LKLGLGILWLRMRKESSPVIEGRRTRHFIETVGGVWMKVGQILAMRNDILDQEFCDELADLQEKAYAFPFEYARRAVEEAAQAPIDEVYSSFEKAPIAAASFAQVYRATLAREGVTVAVKVQRPYADDYFDHDMSLITFLFHTLDRLKIGQSFHWEDMLQELTEMIADELDYRYELSSIRKMKKTLGPQDVYVPRPFAKYSDTRVLVMEFLFGVSLAEMVRVGRIDPIRVEGWLVANQIDRKRVARAMLFTLFRQIFNDNVCHGDLHPGNIMLLKNSQIALLDFGSVATFDPMFMAIYSQYLAALTTRRHSRAADLMLMISGPLPPVDVPALKKEIVRCIRKWERKSDLPKLPFHEKSMGASSTEIGKVMAKFKLHTNWSLLKLGRTFNSMDMSIGSIYPEVNYPRMIRRYYRKANRNQFWKLLEQLRDVPANVGNLVALVEPAVRETLITIEAAKDKVSEFLGGLVKLVYYGTAGATALLWLALVQRLGILPASIGARVEAFLRHRPDVPADLLLPMAIGATALTLLLRRFNRHFSKHHVHLQAARRTR
jgi:ubiquinone biosynthesis protein